MKKKRPPSSLRFQILARTLVVLSILLLLIGTFQYVLMQRFMYNNRAESIQAQIRSLPGQFFRNPEDVFSGLPGPGPSGPKPYLRSGGDLPQTGSRGSGDAGNDSGTMQQADSPDTSKRPGGEHDPLSSLRIPQSTVALVNEKGEIADVYSEPGSGSVPQLSAERYAQVLNTNPKDRRPEYDLVKDADGNEQLVVLQSVGTNRDQPPSMVIQVSVLTTQLHEVLVRQLTTFIGLSVLAMLAALLAFLPVLRRTLIPLSRMVDKVERINAGNLDERLPLGRGQLETERLSVAFNGMLERLETAFIAEQEAKERMRRFVADASHELRTPLTSIRGFLEVLLRGAANNPEVLRESLQSMHTESERLTQLVQDLLQLAKFDNQPELKLISGQLEDVLREMEPQLRVLAGGRRVDIETENSPPLQFNRDQMKQVVLNLFQNAVQHTDAASGHISVLLEPEAAGARLTIRDNGPGIAEEHVSKLFDRFYRADVSRARKEGGAGLGLAITKAIIDFHGGTIACSSKLGEGTAFHVWLPAARTLAEGGMNSRQE